MAYNNGGQRYPQRTSQDRFGNTYSLKFAPQKWNKKAGERIDGVYKTYVEIGGKLYEIEVSRANKTKVINGEEVKGVWVKVTKKNPRSQAAGGGTL